MFFPSTLEKVRALYPEALDAAVTVLRQSRSRRKREPLVSFEWGFEVAVSIESTRIQDVLSGEAAQGREVFEALSLQDKLRDYERRCSVVIVGKYYGRVTIQSEALDKIPVVVLEHQRRHLLAQEAEKRRVAELSADERQAELDRALRQLGRGTGFAAFRRI